MTQHTLGPWEVRTGEFIKDSEGKAIAYCQSSNGTRNVDEVHANACLIAAAPEQQATIDRLETEKANLLEALEYVVEELTRDRSPCGDSIFGGSDITYFQAAIAKARP